MKKTTKRFLKCFGIGGLRLSSSSSSSSSSSNKSKVIQYEYDDNCVTISKPDKESSSSCSSKMKDALLLREFSWQEIESLTHKFAQSRVIGTGGFSTVYRAGPEMAVKIVYGRRVFNDELLMMRQIASSPTHCPAILRLLGYSCHDSDHQVAALVLDYIPNGTLQDSLDTITMTWQQRMAVAHQVAVALDHLHHNCGPLPVVHGDLKPSNVLLDGNHNAVVCDFGSARTGFSSSQRRPAVMAGSPGYTDPHYLRTGIPSKKNDVYSYGVMLLHIITGKAPFCSVTGQLSAGPMEVDPRLPFHAKEAAAMLALAARCLAHPPALRPCSSQILDYISLTNFPL